MKITEQFFCLFMLWLVKSFNVLKLSPLKQKLMVVIYLVLPLFSAAMLIQPTAVAALLPREGGGGGFKREMGEWGGPGLTVCQQTQLEQKGGSPLKGPSTLPPHPKEGRVNRDR